MYYNWYLSITYQHWISVRNYEIKEHQFHNSSLLPSVHVRTPGNGKKIWNGLYKKKARSFFINVSLPYHWNESEKTSAKNYNYFFWGMCMCIYMIYVSAYFLKLQIKWKHIHLPLVFSLTYLLIRIKLLYHPLKLVSGSRACYLYKWGCWAENGTEEEVKREATKKCF